MMNTFQKAMAAVTYAEAGEFETAGEFLEQPGNKAKKVLLAVEDNEIEQKVVTAALSLSQRVGASLEILHVLKTAMASGKAAFAEQLVAKRLRIMGVKYRLVFSDGDLQDEMLKHVLRPRDIIFVVLKSIVSEKNLSPEEKKNFKQIMKRFRCPVVVYSSAGFTCPDLAAGPNR